MNRFYKTVMTGKKLMNFYNVNKKKIKMLNFLLKI